MVSIGGCIKTAQRRINEKAGNMNKTIMMTGGGTAGHVMPHLAIMPLLEEKGFELQYIGTKAGIEHEIIAKTDIRYHAVSAGKLRRYFSLQNFVDPFKIMAGYLQARRILRKTRPAAVFSKGGFVSVPVVFAAKQLGIPVVLHESDYTPGLANKLCIPRASKICVSFEQALKHVPAGKGIYTGLPIREALLQGKEHKGLNLCGFDGRKPVLLIMGGSQGAQALNSVLDEIMVHLTRKYDVAHIRGQNNLLDGQMIDGYKQFGFVGAELADLYAAADVMVSRAGATAVFEILALCLPSLLVPLPLSASRGDQLLNAQHFEESGYAMTLLQEDMGAVTLQTQIDAVYDERRKLSKAMKKAEAQDAAKKVAQVIIDAIK